MSANESRPTTGAASEDTTSIRETHDTYGPLKRHLAALVSEDVLTVVAILQAATVVALLVSVVVGR